MLLHELTDASRDVAATRSRLAKVDRLAPVLAAAGPDEVEIVAAWLGGALRQRRTGLGWRSLADLPAPASEPTLGVVEVDAVLEQMAGLAGAGSQGRRAALLADLMSRATREEQAYLRALITGEVRQGALDGILLDAVAKAAGVPAPTVRRAAMMAGSTRAVVAAALSGGAEALAAYDIAVGRGVSPMLASSASTVAEALAKAAPGAPCAVEAKLDGIRIQAHKDGEEVRLFTRSLDDITSRLPEVVDVVRALPATTLVLDGEALALTDDGRPRPFQETASRTASARDRSVAVTPWFFDVLLRDGQVLVDEPLAHRARVLAELVPARNLVERVETGDADEAQRFFDDVVAQGHEGVVVKDLASPYEAGRRGAGWVKVKPVHTLDLVVLAVEWGSGRRAGTLSNIHLGARDGSGGFVMLGKTFKGMTDEMLAWQTERFLALATERSGHVVHVRPEQVVEIAFDGLQRSSRYPGGLALRFARVVRYRDDKTAAEADTIDTVRAFAAQRGTSEGDDA